MSAIEVQDLSIFAGQQRLLGPVSFKVNTAETLVIMGETGAGKSLIAQAIIGTLPESLHMKGTIRHNGRQIDTLPATQRSHLWGREITMLPQEPWQALDPLMICGRQVAETHQYVAGLSRNEARRQTAQDLSKLGLAEAERRLPGTLSGGMAQRFAFATATAGNAPVLLADEPTKGLDSNRQDQIVALLRDVPKNRGTLIAITHDCAVAAALGGELLVLKDGQIVEQGITQEVLANPQAGYTKQLLGSDPAAWPKSPSGNGGKTLLCAHNLCVGRANIPLVEDLSLNVKAGERIAVCGPSGVGKTSLLDTLAGLLKPLRGRVERATDLGPHAVQKLYQDPPTAFPPHMTLARNLQDVAGQHGVAWERVLEHVGDLGLHPALLERKPDSVSGGELQRISIARALIVKPKVLLADEPTSRLDPVTQRDTLELIEKTSRANNIAIVLVTHSRQIADNWADRSINLT